MRSPLLQITGGAEVTTQRAGVVATATVGEKFFTFPIKAIP